MNTARPDAPEVKVSIAMVTYNHEAYIAQAIESVLMQQTDFKYELVIGEDCSSDATRHVVEVFCDRYPGRIRLLLQERNQGAQINFLTTLRACRGQYIAILEGDDYWLSPHKIQRQVDFMEAQTDFALCFCRTVTVCEIAGSQANFIPYAAFHTTMLTVDDLLVYNCIAMCSVMYRAALVANLPDWFSALSIGDWPLHIFAALKGKAGFLDETMCAYRLHGASAHSSLDITARLAMIVQFYEIMGRHLDRRYAGLVNEMLANTYQRLAYASLRQGNLRRAVASARQSLRSTPLRSHWRSGRLAAGWRKLLAATMGRIVDL